MNMKNKLKRFFTLSRNHDGFTLVELIVVIAIMAILAGVGSVGYAGYIKSANKKADMVLVGNVMRAIETGTNSTMFVNDDSFKMGKLSFPVGIVVLSPDKEDGTVGNCQVMASNAEKKEVSSECKMKTITNYVPSGGYSVRTETGTLSSVDVYTITRVESITFCENHSTEMVSRVATSFKKNFLGGVSGTDYKDYVFAKDCVGAYALATDHTENGSITREELEAIQNMPRVDVTEEGPLYDSLVAAFGSDLSGLKLKYANWTSEEGINYASANSYLGEAYTELKKIAGVAANQGLIGEASKLYFGKNWDTPEAAMNEATQAINTMYGNNEEAWLNAWKNTANEQYDQCGFGMNTGNPTADKVGYNTLRMQYNQAFASYLLTKDVPEKYANVVVKFDSGVHIGDVYLPAVVNKSAFAVDAEGNNASGLKEKLKKAGDADGAWFAKINEYYNEYLNSPAYEENAKAAMALNTTMAENGAAAMKHEDGYMGYFQNYIDEMDAMYTAAENAAGDGIVIIVAVENGKLNFQVSPAAANPRPLNN